MTTPDNIDLSNPIAAYDEALQGLSKDPHNRALQHRLVLSLARAGATHFAAAEYQRLGLYTVDNDEDIMALGARLSKDLYLQDSSSAARDHATRSADQYQAAFAATGGYYGAVNAATMRLLSGAGQDTVLPATEACLAVLSDSDTSQSVSARDTYFIQASRAECYLLRGEESAAQETLDQAVSFDPLNFVAHAATLKQFKMIADFKGQDSAWLDPFTPPKTVHFAGHLLALGKPQTKTHPVMDPPDIAALSVALSDMIQRHDIGYGFGSLAAGSDLLIAQGLLDEGADLHVVLPTNPEPFMSASVIPFGQAWEARFHACLSAAKSVTIVADTAPWPDPALNRFAGQIAMGQAIIHSRTLAAKAVQMLIWNDDIPGSYTARHARDWDPSGHERITINLPQYQTHNARANRTDRAKEGPSGAIIRLAQKGGSGEDFGSPMSAARAAIARTQNASSHTIAIATHHDFAPANPALDVLLDQGIKGSVLITEGFASLLALHDKDHDFTIAFAGRAKGAWPDKSGLGMRIFTLSQRCN